MSSTTLSFLSTKEAAARSGYASDYVSRLCRGGRIAACQVGKAWKIEAESFDSFVKAQTVRKVELAENLSRTREAEYRLANPPQSRPIPERTHEKVLAEAAWMLRSLARARFASFSMPRVTGPAYSLALTALVLIGSVSLAGSGLVATAGSAFVEGAFAARAATLDAVYAFDTHASAKRAVLAEAARREVRSNDHLLARASANPIVKIPDAAHALIAAGMPERESILASLQKEQQERQPAERPGSREPLRMAVVVPGEDTGTTALRAYAYVGAYALHQLDGALSAHARLIDATGVATLTSATLARDTGSAAFAYAGAAAVMASERSLALYERGVYAYVSAAPIVPETVLVSVHAIGDRIANLAAQGMHTAPAAYSEAEIAYVTAVASASERFSSSTFAAGQNGGRVIASVLAPSGSSLATAMTASDEARERGLESTTDSDARAGVLAASVGSVPDPSDASEPFFGSASAVVLSVFDAVWGLMSVSDMPSAEQAVTYPESETAAEADVPSEDSATDAAPLASPVDPALESDIEDGLAEEWNPVVSMRSSEDVLAGTIRGQALTRESADALRDLSVVPPIAASRLVPGAYVLPRDDADRAFSGDIAASGRTREERAGRGLANVREEEKIPALTLPDGAREERMLASAMLGNLELAAAPVLAIVPMESKAEIFAGRDSLKIFVPEEEPEEDIDAAPFAYRLAMVSVGRDGSPYATLTDAGRLASASVEDIREWVSRDAVIEEGLVLNDTSEVVRGQGNGRESIARRRDIILARVSSGEKEKVAGRLEPARIGLIEASDSRIAPRSLSPPLRVAMAPPARSQSP
ncbi:MAG: helix-turn-helix domain-containing protein [Patescibacteria group bacterium]